MLQGTGFVADVAVGDLDSLQESGLPWRDLTKEVQAYSSHKDLTDTELAVELALGSGAGCLWLFGGGGGRMDHWLSNLRLFESSPAIGRWYTPFDIGFRLGEGLSLRLSDGRVSVFPVGLGPWQASSQGLRWPLDQVDFSRWHSLSNVAQTGATIESQQGEFLVLQDWTGELLESQA